MNKYLLGCDWGTSSFRLRLLELSDNQVLGEVVSPEGIARVHQSWESASGNPAGSRKALFIEYLSEQVKVLSGKLSVNLEGVPVIISGMASSSIGIEEVQYATVPFNLDGSGAIVRRLASDSILSNEIMLVSGVCTDKDVMRGEETQLLGVLQLLKQEGNLEGTLIFPGTHSKHVYIQSGQLVNFRTFMTGELFSIVCQHSILKNSVLAGEKDMTTVEREAFKSGVCESKSAGVLNGLFTVRTNQLFEKFDKKQNFFYLSGLLIGAELHYLLESSDKQLYLCSGTNLYDFYTLALEELGLLVRTTVVASELVDKAALIGQKLIYVNHTENK